MKPTITIKIKAILDDADQTEANHTTTTNADQFERAFRKFRNLINSDPTGVFKKLKEAWNSVKAEGKFVVDPNQKEHLNNEEYFRDICMLHHACRNEAWEILTIDGSPAVDLVWNFPIYEGKNKNIIAVISMDAIVRNKETNTVCVLNYKTPTTRDSCEYCKRYKTSYKMLQYYSLVDKYIKTNPNLDLHKAWTEAETTGCLIDAAGLSSILTNCSFQTSDVLTYDRMQVKICSESFLRLCEIIDQRDSNTGKIYYYQQ